MDSVEKILKLLGLEKDELAPCDIYINYFMQYIASIERKISELKSKVEYLEDICFKNVKEINK
ncbi:MAG: hypothetical protein ACPL3C_03965 [Pyrobaculum sp.]|uniref:Uncharacterized protein n=1 Tax=Pyrobaculum ferrireducens TaxID=1104324 RepID=G7VHV2_9CREN|nr:MULTISPECIES: hypothetical protein [Pyrobaculum]AET32124.1 hypothetical protein P186_0673 [Pyrobaculum ferrireducens]MCU7786689.1 hypothetical protein [Pyrobaculum sp. 3827-6]